MQAAGAHGEQHQPLRVYLTVWGTLFVLSAMSYFVDFFDVEPLALKRFLLVAFALAKAGLIVSYFMHVRYERLSLVYVILLPPILLLGLVSIAMMEAEYVSAVRQLLLGG